MQDEIVSSLANELNAELVAAEARRAADAPNPTSMISLSKVNIGLIGASLLNACHKPERFSSGH